MWPILQRLSAAAMLILFSPALLLIALAIRLESPGPAVEGRGCVGADRRAFQRVLFRTRHRGQLTRLGRVLRRCSFDELPQLVNVVRGEMNLIGPRPKLL